MDIFVCDIISFVKDVEHAPDVSYWCENNTPELSEIYERHGFKESYIYASHLMYFIHVIGKMRMDAFNVLVAEYSECQYVDYVNSSC